MTRGSKSRSTGGGMGAFFFLHGHRMKRSSLEQYGHFEARPGQTMEWVISLPEEMVREAESGSSPIPLGKTG